MIRWQLLLQYALFLAGFGIQAIPGVNSWWPSIIVWIVASVWLLITLVYVFCRQKRRPIGVNDEIKWIDRYKSEHGKYPVIPEYLIGFALNYRAGDQVHKKVKLKTPDPDTWEKLTPTRKEEFLQLCGWLGYNRQEMLDKIHAGTSTSEDS
jgi:hypothetical protein